MTVYELADELLRDNTQLTVKAAYMLRQQADRIVELEKELITKYGKLGQSIPCSINTTPQTKPLSDELLDTRSYLIGRYDSKNHLKPLSDEEIKKLYESSFDWDKRMLWTFRYEWFARAIEERHGIK